MTQQLKKIHFRPHHFLCTIGFQGKGYSLPFIENYLSITNLLKAPGGDDVMITVVDDTDDICQPCPNRSDKTCTMQEKITALDKAHAQVLQIKPGDEISWKEAKTRIKQHMTKDKFHQSCAGCSWKDLGICEKALNELG